jgi:hypothetical protein
VVQAFDDRTPAVFAEAESSPGFIERAREVGQADLSNFERNWGKWGRFCVPRFYTLGRTTGTDQRASTLTLWTDLTSVFRFVYAGLHASALRSRSAWFMEPHWPTYAVWWVADDHTPQWTEAIARLELLHDRGSGPDAFDFKHAYDQNGNPIDLKRLVAGSADETLVRPAPAPGAT